MNNKPNIVLIIIDSLRADRLGVSGYIPALTPVLDELATTGIYYSNNFSAGCPTQVAFPSIFTSSRPFDYGGYSDGIHERPYTFVEKLKEGGYSTFGLTTGHPSSSHFGYARGFDDFIDLIDMYQWFRAAYITRIGDSINAWDNKKITDDAVIQYLQDKYKQILKDSLLYLKKLDSIKASEHGKSRKTWFASIIKEIKILENKPLSIAYRFVELGNEYHYALGTESTSNYLKMKLKVTAYFDKLLNKRIFIRSRRKAYLADEVNSQVSNYYNNELKKPFFSLIHYFDLHESKLLIPNLNFKRLLKLPFDIYTVLKNRTSGCKGGLLYDLGLVDQDRSLGELLKIFKKTNNYNNTLFIITGDHGLDTGNPHRGVGSDLSQFFYDNFIKVPLIINGVGVDRKINTALVSHCDLGPTILAYANIDIPAEFIGRDLSKNVNNEPSYVLFENAGNGRCDFNEKTLYVGIRTKKIKLVTKIDGYKVEERDVFDLEKDPDEKNNIVNTNLRMSEREECINIIRERVKILRIQNSG